MKYRLRAYIQTPEEDAAEYSTLQAAMDEAEHIESMQPGEVLTLIEHIDNDGLITLIYPYAYQYNQS